MKTTIDFNIHRSQNQYENFQDIDSEASDMEPIQTFKSKHNSEKFSKRFTWKAILISVLTLAILTDLLIQYNPTKSDEIASKITAPAKRVVIFFTDGTKADTLYGFFSNGTARAPFLRDIIMNKGSFGVSYAGLPTETRVCTTMMLSGHHVHFREIFDLYFGQKTQSDHIFNKSKHTIAFGMEEIIGLFKEPKTPSNVEFYPFLNLSTDPDDHMKETNNVMGQFLGYFDEVKSNSRSAVNLTGDQLLMLLHLVSVDSSGHDFGGMSEEYEGQIAYLDKMISKAVKTVEDYYQDDGTAYILTSDHGMREIKMHTGNSDNVIRTPIIAWGAGIVRAEKEKVLGESHDEYSNSWKFEGIKRKDILQIDVSALAASLLGVPIPQNSEAKIPLDYLAISESEKAEEAYRNAQQLCSSFHNRKEMMDKKLAFSSWPDTTGCNERLIDINQSIDQKSYAEAILKAETLIDETFTKIQEMKLNDRNTQLFLIGVAVLSWICLCVESFFKITKTNSSDKRPRPFVWFLLAGVGAFYLISKGSPFYHFIYLILPLYLSRNFFLSQTICNLRCLRIKTAFIICLYFAVAYIFSFSFNMRKDILAICFGVWALFNFSDYRSNRPFLALSIVASIFVVQILISFDSAEVRYPFLVLVAAIAISFYSFAGRKFYSKSRSFIVIPIINVVSGALVILYEYFDIIVKSMNYDREEFDKVVTNVHEIITKINILLMIVVFFSLKKFINTSSDAVIPKIVILFSLLAPFYILESISFESLFYLGFAAILTLWAKGELSVIKQTENISIANSFKLFIGYQIMFQLAYFGFGNASTYDRFNLDVNFRFFSTFGSIKMGVLMLVKDSIPYLMLNYAFQLIVKNKFKDVSPLFVSLLGLVGPFFTMLWLSFPSKPDYKHPTLQIAYPIICSFLILTNIAMARVSNYLLSK